MFKKDLFIERIVRRSLGPSEIFIKTMVTMTTIILFIILNMIPILFNHDLMGILFAVSLGIIYLGYRMFISVNTEYEYSLTNDDFTIDRIIAKRKRSQIFSASCKDFQAVAPVDSDAYFEALNSDILLFDYSSGNRGADVWFFLLDQRGKKIMIVFEFDERIVEGFRKYNPRNVSKIENVVTDNNDE